MPGSMSSPTTSASAAFCSRSSSAWPMLPADTACGMARNDFVRPNVRLWLWCPSRSHLARSTPMPRSPRTCSATDVRRWIWPAFSRAVPMPASRTRRSPGSSVWTRRLSHITWRCCRCRQCSMPRCEAAHRSRLRRGAVTMKSPGRSRRLRGLDARAAAVIRVDAVWLAVEPLDMRAGTEAALARVVARLRCRPPAPRLPVRQPPRQPHEGARARRHRRVAGRAAAEPGQVRLAQGRGATLALTRAQLDALVLGLPWQRIGEAGVISVSVGAAQLPDVPMCTRRDSGHDHAP